ncbi:MAG: hypothetical protein LWW82_13840, partial [Comamonadaceae bacterium]|nr:hypothetical protein [Comamonadaceae bacterium]
RPIRRFRSSWRPSTKKAALPFIEYQPAVLHFRVETAPPFAGPDSDPKAFMNRTHPYTLVAAKAVMHL